jgi:polyisoprenoid-binding protein YceI
MNKTIAASLISLLSVSSTLLASPQTFDFKDPKGVNNAIFKLDAPLEAIQGSANGISGAVTFDPQTGALKEGKLVITTETLHVPNPMMNQHLHGNQWMDVAKYPEITFTTKSLNDVKVAGDTTTAEAVGTLTVKGVSKEIKAPVKLTYLRDKLAQRVPNMKGDLLVLRSHFTIKRSDFGINPGAPMDKVSDEIELALSIAGAAVK